MQDTIYHTICRCCLTDEGSMKNMQEEMFESDNHKKIRFLEGFTRFSGIQFEQDNTCKNICQKCEDKLKISYDFKELCETSYLKLKDQANLLNDVKEEEVSDAEDTSSGIIYQQSQPGEERSQFSQVFVMNESEAKSRSSKIDEEVAKLEEITIGKSEDEGCSDRDIENEEMEVDLGLTDEQKPSIKDDRPAFEPILEGNFICHICDKFFESLRDYKDHKKSHIWDLGIKIIQRVCNLCNKEVDGYLRHIKHKHSDYKPNTCKTCGKGYQQQNHLQSHLMTHIDGKQYQCQGCDSNFQNTKRLKYHIIRTKHTTDKYHCPECGLGSSTFALFLEHFKVHYSDTITRKFYPCFHCKNIFMRQSNVRNHECDPTKPVVANNLNSKQLKRQKTGKGVKKSNRKSAKPSLAVVEEPCEEKPHECERCLAVFSTGDELLCHQFSFCDEKTSFLCTICKKEFRTNYLFASHNRNFHEERKFVCDQCGYKCVSEARLILHQVTHRKERSFKCDLCTLSFKDFKGWKTHQMAHEERKFECYLCAKKFRSIVTIRIHMGCHIESLKTFSCEFCPKKYGRLVDKERHMAVHTGKFVRCNICSKEYRTAKGLEHHIELLHEGVRYDCNVCHQSLASRRQLYEHLFLHRGFRPYNCPDCARPFLKKDRFQKHLITHNIKFDEKKHGYKEMDRDIAKLIDSCINKNSKRPSSKAEPQVTYDTQAVDEPHPEMAMFGASF